MESIGKVENNVSFKILNYSLTDPNLKRNRSKNEIRYLNFKL